MEGRKFKVEIVEVLNDENGFKGEEWHAVTEDGEVKNTFEVRNEDVAIALCDLLNEKDQEIIRLLEKLLESKYKELDLLRRLKKYLNVIMIDKLILVAMEIEGIEYEIETDKSICFYSVPSYDKSMKYSAIYDLHSKLKNIDALIIDISEAEDSDDNRDMLYVQIEV